MNATIVVLRVDGHGVEHLSLHTKREQALRAAEGALRVAWTDRFGYYPAPLSREVLVDRSIAEGWRVRIEEREVEL